MIVSVGSDHLHRKLESRNLHAFEVASLANLVPDDVDEAKELIPSLSSRLDDEDIDTVLKELTRFRTCLQCSSLYRML